EAASQSARCFEGSVIDGHAACARAVRKQISLPDVESNLEKAIRRTEVCQTPDRRIRRLESGRYAFTEVRPRSEFPRILQEEETGAPREGIVFVGQKKRLP